MRCVIIAVPRDQQRLRILWLKLYTKAKRLRFPRRMRRWRKITHADAVRGGIIAVVLRIVRLLHRRLKTFQLTRNRQLLNSAHLSTSKTPFRWSISC